MEAVATLEKHLKCVYLANCNIEWIVLWNNLIYQCKMLSNMPYERYIVFVVCSH